MDSGSSAVTFDRTGNFEINTPLYKASGGPTDTGSALLALSQLDSRNLVSVAPAILPALSLAFPVLAAAVPVAGLAFSLVSQFMPRGPDPLASVAAALSKQLNGVFNALSGQIDNQTKTLLTALSVEAESGSRAAVLAAKAVSEQVADSKRRLLTSYQESADRLLDMHIQTEKKISAIYTERVAEGMTVYENALQQVYGTAGAAISGYLQDAAKEAAEIAELENYLQELKKVDAVEFANYVVDAAYESIRAQEKRGG